MMYRGFIKNMQKYFSGVPLALLSGAFLGVSFIHSRMWPLVFIGGACFLVLLFNREYSNRRVFMLGWLVGFIIVGCAMYGLYWHTLPLTWLGLGEESLWQVMLVGFIWFYTSFFISLAYGLWAVVVRFLSTQTWADIIIIPSLWVFAELLGAIIFYVQQYGPGGSVFSIDYTYQFIGYQLAEDSVLLQIASVGSIFGLSMVVMMVSTILYRLYRARPTSTEKKVLLGVLVSLGIFWIVGHHILPTTHNAEEYIDNKTTLFGVVSTHMMGLRDTKTQLAMQKELVDGLEVDIVVLPEGAELLSKMDEYGEAYPTSAKLYIDSTTVYDGKGIASEQINYYSPGSGEVTHSYKFILMPIGEYVPAIVTFISRITGFDKTETFDHMLKYRQYVPRDYPEPMHTPRGAVLGTLFCNEKLSPTLYRSLTRDGAEVLVNVSSHLWFNNSRIVFNRQQHLTRVRAVESGRWYVQADNMAPSYILDNHGNVVLQPTWEAGNGVLRIDVPLLHTITPYVRFGLWVLAAPGMVIIMNMLWLLKKRGSSRGVREANE